MKPDFSSIHLKAYRADWVLIRRVYGKNGGAFAESMLAKKVSKVANALRAEGITDNSWENRKRLLEICA